MWEIIEPIIQNSIDHNDKDLIIINIITEFDEENNCSMLTISDNGPGITNELMKLSSDNVKTIFRENTSTKTEDKNHGYGCYLSFEIAKRCGWEIEVENSEEGGAKFYLKIKN